MAHDLLSPLRGMDPVDWAISRTVTVPHTVPVPTEELVLNSNQQTDWQFTIREISGIADLKVTVTVAQQASNYIIEQPVGRGGGLAISRIRSGAGSCGSHERSRSRCGRSFASTPYKLC